MKNSRLTQFYLGLSILAMFLLVGVAFLLWYPVHDDAALNENSDSIKGRWITAVVSDTSTVNTYQSAHSCCGFDNADDPSQNPLGKSCCG